MHPHLPDWAQGLGLQPHPEGGYYRETWRSPVAVPADVLPGEYFGERSLATAILFLLLPGTESAWHVVASDELWLHHRGSSLAVTLGGDDPAGPTPVETCFLGGDLGAGEEPQVLVPAGTWQTARPVHNEAVLVSCVVTPGFDFRDFRLRDTPAL